MGPGAGGPRRLPGVNTSRSGDSGGLRVVSEHFLSWGGSSQPTAFDWLLDSLLEVYDFISLEINFESKYLIWRCGVRKKPVACATCRKVGELLRWRRGCSYAWRVLHAPPTPPAFRLMRAPWFTSLFLFLGVRMVLIISQLHFLCDECLPPRGSFQN